MILRREREPGAVERRANEHFHIVGDERAVDGDGQRLPPLVELPAVHALRSVTEVQAAVARQIARRLRRRMRGEVLGRADDGRPLIGRHADRDHVALDEPAEMNAGVEAGADEIEASLLGRGQVEEHVGVVAGELTEFRGEHHPRRQAGRDECRRAGSSRKKSDAARFCSTLPPPKPFGSW